MEMGARKGGLMSRKTKKPPAWDDVSWISVGTEVRFLGSPVAQWTKADKSDRRELRPGMTGKVVGFTDGYPPHRCPDHASAPDCICGDTGGIVSANDRMAIIAWNADGGEYQRLAGRDDEGDRFERVKA